MSTYLSQCQNIGWMEKHADSDLHIQRRVCERQRGLFSHGHLVATSTENSSKGVISHVRVAQPSWYEMSIKGTLVHTHDTAKWKFKHTITSNNEKRKGAEKSIQFLNFLTCQCINTPKKILIQKIIIVIVREHQSIQVCQKRNNKFQTSKKCVCLTRKELVSDEGKVGSTKTLSRSLERK